MKAEIIAVGTELLIGQVVNTNATFLSEELVGLGYDIYYHSVVGDNRQRLESLIRLASERSELVVLCGGLGPTEDDLTREVLADYLDEPLVLDEVGYQKIENYLQIQGRKMTENNRRQGLSISGGIALQNPTGLAVGTFYKGKDSHYLLLPGPPSELKSMFYEQAVPLLKKLLPQTEFLTSRVLRFFGIGESTLVMELKELIERQTDPTIAPYAAPNEVRLRLSTKASNEKMANVKLDEVETYILAKVGQYFYGYGEHNSLANVVVSLLKEQGQTLAVAESLTAGLVQSTLGKIAGVSEVFLGGFVTYTNEVKHHVLGVPQDVLTKYGAVSEECALAMAKQTLIKTGADYALSLTGVAGPSDSEGKGVGTTWIGLATTENVVAKCFHFQRDREYIQHSAMMTGLNILREELLKK